MMSSMSSARCISTPRSRRKKADVNGEDELPLYTWLKSQKGFEGFDEHPYKELLEKMFREADPDWDKSRTSNGTSRNS